ncbi:hypothetical protein ACFL9T_02720 [Thermodesulfobacteriota bacterium]
MVDKACKPLQGEGGRNVFCPFYNRCLNHAVKETWQYWSCGGCRHKLDQGARPEMKLIASDSIEYSVLI